MFQKNQTRNIPEKLGKENFELNQFFTHNFLCQNDKIFINNFELYLVFL